MRPITVSNDLYSNKQPKIPQIWIDFHISQNKSANPQETVTRKRLIEKLIK